MNDKLERIWEDVVVAKSRCIPDIWLHELSKTMTRRVVSVSRFRSALVDTRPERDRCTNSLGTESDMTELHVSTEARRLAMRLWQEKFGEGWRDTRGECDERWDMN
jgi:hypothetical protein